MFTVLGVELIFWTMSTNTNDDSIKRAVEMKDMADNEKLLSMRGILEKQMASDDSICEKLAKFVGLILDKDNWVLLGERDDSQIFKPKYGKGENGEIRQSKLCSDLQSSHSGS